MPTIPGYEVCVGWVSNSPLNGRLTDLQRGGGSSLFLMAKIGFHPYRELDWKREEN